MTTEIRVGSENPAGEQRPEVPKIVLPTPTTKGNADKTIGRRTVLKTLGGATLLATGFGIASRGWHPERWSEEMRDGQIKLLFANHILPGQIDTLQSDYVVNGANDLSRVSVWDTTSLTFANEVMKEEKRRGQKTSFFMIDGSNALISNPSLALPSVNWTVIPHPELNKQIAYPEKMKVIGADIYNDTYGIGSLIGTEKLVNDLESRYGQPNYDLLKKYAKQLAPKVLIEKGIEAALASILISAGAFKFIPHSRRAFIGSLITAGVGVTELIKGLGQTNLTALATGNTANPDLQNLITKINDLTDWSFAIEPQKLSNLARSSILIEKAEDYTKHIFLGKADQNATINILLGSEHVASIPEIKNSQKFRMECIADFLKDQINFIRTMIQNKYPYLLPRQDQILEAACERITQSTIFDIQIPWSTTSIPPGGAENFERKLVTPEDQYEHATLQKLVKTVLLEAGVQISKAG
ncbi:MAG TPA: hypothetical protein VNW29_05355 [Candidatus Sulfotelmatobacter sp.]|jgi:hypothetical protein|nr:hypothetical protein [Candidatus Sulfotelmatobacter sp.]